MKRLTALTLPFLLLMPCAAAYAQSPPPPGAPGSLPGILPLPPGPPPTGLVRPVPAPTKPLPPADQPIPQSPLPPDTKPLTLNDAVSLALAQSPVIAQANAGLLTALGQMEEYRSALRPTLSADAGMQAYSQGINAVRDNRVVDTQTHALPTIGALATLPIDISGALHAASDAAHFEEIAARLDVNRARNEVVAGVEAAFYNALRAQALVHVAEENLQNSSARLDDANKKFQARTVGILDVVRAQTDVAEAEQGLIVARSNNSLQLAALSNAIGLDINTPLRITDTGAVDQPPGVAPPAVSSVPAAAAAAESTNAAPSPTMEEDIAAAATAASARIAQANAAAQANSHTAPPLDPLHLGPDFDALITEALKTRPEVLQADADIAASKKNIVYAHRSSLPQFSVGMRYEYAASTFGTSVVLNNGQAFAGLTIPLYDAGLAHARIQEAKGREATAKIHRRRLTDAVSLETRQAYLNLAQARDRVAVANQALSEAREAFLLARLRYNAGVTQKSGVSPLLEVSDAQAALTLAETRQVNALYDYNSSRVALDRALGRYSFLIKKGTGPVSG